MDVGRPSPSRVGGAAPGLEALDATGKEAEQAARSNEARKAKAAGLRGLHGLQFLPPRVSALIPALDFLQ